MATPATTMSSAEAESVFQDFEGDENTFTSAQWVNMEQQEQFMFIREDSQIVFPTGETFKVRSANRGEEGFSEDGWKEEGFVMWSGEGTKSGREKVFEAMAIIMKSWSWNWQQTDCGQSFVCKFE